MASKVKKNKQGISNQIKFNKQLVLNQYMLSFLGVKTFDEIGHTMKSPQYEGFSEDNNSNFYHFLTSEWKNNIQISKDKLLQYDNNIVKHTSHISEKREIGFSWKYFQYLSLLFTEIYLDRFFNDSDDFLLELNNHVKSFNEDKLPLNQIELYELSDLKKLAFWMATGSGKTLLMHMNILQYMNYIKESGKENEINKIILLTPNSGLSNQHYEEFKKSNLKADFFDKELGDLMRWAELTIEIIDIHKIEEEAGEKTVAIDSFESNNLVLVDEGHRGSSGIIWKEKRDRLSKAGFSFEYSATFGQAMKASRKKNLIQEYAKCILFDYSYRFFHTDGYGKDYRILNLNDDSNETARKLYLTACLLTFYQQKKIFRNQKVYNKSFLIEDPLFVFVGASVLKGKSNTESSDIIEVLTFFSQFLKNEKESINQIDRLLSGSPGLLDNKGIEIFRDTFKYLKSLLSFDASTIYRDILKVIFNTETLNAELHIENLKGATGEIGIRIGENEYFGVINVGDDKKLLQLCSESGLLTAEKEFSESLFRKINKPNSYINILIGSKKFTEGWSSWRVGTMGLLNVGQSEGAEIIQLFGRGVRLKGYDYSLKRSKFLKMQRPELDIPKYLDLLETLNIFGIKANYMKQFEEYLKEEELNEGKKPEYRELSIKRNENIDLSNLKTLRVKKGLNFKKQGPNPVLSAIEGNEFKKIIIDWYPKIQFQSSSESVHYEESKQHGILEEKHLAFINVEEIFFEMQHYKNIKGWHNLNITIKDIEDLLYNPSWYILLIPEKELEFTDFNNFKKWQSIAIMLLKKYCEFFYKYQKAAWEYPHLTYSEMKLDDENFIKEEKFMITVNHPEDNDSLLSMLDQLEEKISSSDLKSINFKDYKYGNFEPLYFERHLYNPLIFIKKNSTEIEVSPVHLNEGERKFILDLEIYFNKNLDFFNDKELYLIRNKSKSGIGFFEANNFYPDFIMWMNYNGRQYISFIDPKGIRNLRGKEDPKIQLSMEIKEIQNDLSDQDSKITLNSFIVSGTAYDEVSHWGSQEELKELNVLFQNQDQNYIEKIFKTVLE